MKQLLFITFIVLPLHVLAQDKIYSIVFLNKKDDAAKLSTEDSKTIMEGHIANINRLASERKLLAAGPFDGGGGLFILNTTSVEEAQGWLNTDPVVKANR